MPLHQFNTLFLYRFRLCPQGLQLPLFRRRQKKVFASADGAASLAQVSNRYSTTASVAPLQSRFLLFDSSESCAENLCRGIESELIELSVEPLDLTNQFVQRFSVSFVDLHCAQLIAELI